MDARLPIQCQVCDVHGWNTEGFQGCLLLGDQTLPGDGDTLGEELVQFFLVRLCQRLAGERAAVRD